MPNRMLRFALCALAPLLMFAPALHADPFETTFELIPAAPRYMEDVRLRGNRGLYDCYFRGDVAMNGTKITLSAWRFQDFCFGPVDFDLGRFPAGEYSVEIVGASGLPGPPPILGTISFVVPSRPAHNPSAGPGADVPSDVNYTDLWWNPERPGWGVMITHRPDDTLFAAWFDYGTDGQPTWYTFLSRKSGVTGFTGPIMRSYGPASASPPFVQSIGMTVVGEGKFGFGPNILGVPGEYSKGNMSVQIDGVLHTSPIERFSFD